MADTPTEALDLPQRQERSARLAYLSQSLPDGLYLAQRARSLSLSSDTEAGVGNGKRSKKNIFIIGVAGGTASGKTSVCRKIVEALENHRLAIISQDCFYRELKHEDLENVGEYNFDHPDAFDWALLLQTITDLKAGRMVEIPTYDFVTHSRTPETTTIYGVEVVLLEGILLFHSEQLCRLLDMKIFVDTDADTRLARRIVRDIKERGRDLAGILKQYDKFVKPSFDTYIAPTKRAADVIIPRGSDNYVAINLIVQHISAKLDENDPTAKGKKAKKISHFGLEEETEHY